MSEVAREPDPLFSVVDQRVVISGGSRGIGRAIAAEFARRGAEVLITGRQREVLQATAEQLSTGKHPVTVDVCDVAQADDVESFCERLESRWPHVDTLVNVAGVNRRKPAEEVTLADYDFVMNVNLRGAFLLSQAIGKTMLARGAGSQINIVSLNSDRPLKHVAPYAMSKAGMAQMTRALALEWSGRGVRVNGLAPGFVLTDLTTQLWSDPTMQAWAAANTPQQRLGRPEDLVGTAIFLAAPAAAFITGQIIYVDGGFTAGWAWPIPAGGGQK